MRKFIMSDINGFKNVYYSMMTYLDNISQTDTVELYINGNLVGIDDDRIIGAKLLSDVMWRIKTGNNNFKIFYLAGNNEVEIYKTLKDIDEPLFFGQIVAFLSNLPIYHRFDEKMSDRRIVLAHASCPPFAMEKCNIFVKDVDVDKSIKDEMTKCIGVLDRKPYDNIGSRNYFSIVGHNPCNSPSGYNYEYNDNYLNIDGGCEIYLKGFTDYNHFPLVEIYTDEEKDESSEARLDILTFNSNNEIICGNHFSRMGHIPYTQEELDEARRILNGEKQSRI